MIKTLAFSGDPFAVFKKFTGKAGLFFLDSSQASKDARHSYLGFSPIEVIRTKDMDYLRKGFKRYAGGAFAVGYLGYDGTLCFGFYDQYIVFDHIKKTLTIHAKKATVLKNILDIIRLGPIHVPILEPRPRRVIYKSNFSKSTYVAAVKKALVHIKKGDIYQINLSRKIEAMVPQGGIDPIAVYGALRQSSPSPFASYLDDGSQIIMSSSPERFIKLSGRTVEVKPMKGTRPRGASPALDARYKKDLEKSPKEIAELLMVTDLERNDLGRVCSYGTVKVRHLRTIETYKTVFQATSTIEGQLHKEHDGFDLLKAAFPSGSVTGCPKIEAMKIIRMLEKDSRGNYTGALGYIDGKGNMDFSVLIRTLFVTKNKITFHVGGGIVADSNPAAEYEETCLKAKGMEQALSEVFCA